MPAREHPPPVIAELAERPELGRLLRQTADLLESRSCWGQRHYEQEHRALPWRIINRLRPNRPPCGPSRTRYCLVGAIYRTARLTAISRQTAASTVMLLDWHVYAAGRWPKPDAMSYNDARGRRLPEITATLRDAARAVASATADSPTGRRADLMKQPDSTHRRRTAS